LIARVPNAPGSLEAHIYMAKLELVLARSMKAAGRPDAEWLNHVESARMDLDAGIGGAEPSMIEEYRGQIAALTAETPPTVVQTSPPGQVTSEASGARKKKKIDDLLSKADGLWKSDPDGAETYVDQVLEMQPDNKHAQELQENIRRRKEFLAK
jgi:hypothetical protein